MIFIAVHIDLGSIARIYVMIRHFFGRLEHGIHNFGYNNKYIFEETRMPIVVCSLIRQAFIGYVCLVMISIAIDRLLASKYWIWLVKCASSTFQFVIYGYDNDGLTTTMFFVVSELFLLTLVYIGSFRVVFGLCVYTATNFQLFYRLHIEHYEYVLIRNLHDRWTFRTFLHFFRYFN